MSNKNLGGIRGVLGNLTGADEALEPVTLPEPAETAPEAPDVPPTPEPVAQPKPAKAAKAPQQAVEVSPARRGRPPGRKSGERVPKKKATLWVSASLLEEYVDWSWDERCNIGELIERALLDYKKRRRGSRPHPDESPAQPVTE
jgi:hypothetical protein